MPAVRWAPTAEFLRTTNLWWLMQRVGVDSYPALHAWTVAHRDEFWEIVRERLAFRPGNVAANCLGPAAATTAIIHQAEGGACERMSPAELDRRSNGVARGLVTRGLVPGDAVAVDLPMTATAVAIYLGIIKAGGVVVSVADSFMPPEIAVRLRVGRARLVFTAELIRRGGKTLPLLERVVAAGGAAEIICVGQSSWEPFAEPADEFAVVPRAAADHLNILFSSGTTGEPKAIPWTHETPLKCAMDGHFHQDIQPGDVVAWPTNLGWMMGPWLIFAALLNRATIALYDGAPAAAEFGRFVQDARVRMLGLVPSLVKAWRSSGAMDEWDWSAIKCFSSTGECSNAADMAWLMQRAGHKPVIEYCGGTEIGGGYITGSLAQPAVPAMFSTAALGLDFVILDEAGRDTDNGEVFLVPPSIGLSTELLNADHQAVYYGGVPRPGLRRHGDQIERLPDGYYRALGRVDDTMNLGGIKISSREIEDCVQAVAGVRESAAIAVTPSAGGPSELVIYVVGAGAAAGGPERTALRQALQDRLRVQLNPLFKIQEVVLIEALPRTASNKVRRRDLRTRYEQRQA